MCSASRLLTALAAALLAAPAAAAQSPAPSLSLDPVFAPPSGIARDGGAGTGTDIPGGVAVDGDRIYVVGESNGVVAVIARAGNGTYDPAFGGDGRVDIDLGNGKDVGSGIAGLPDGRLRILAATDSDTTSSTNMDVAVIGLNRDGSFDQSFGGGDGRVSFPIGVIDDSPSRMAVDEAGRIAITGWRKDAGGKEDTFVAMLNPDGTPDESFDGDGILTIDRAGNNVNDRGIDIAWRGAGVIVLHQVATNPDINVNDYASVLHAFDAAGAADNSFSDDADLVLQVGDPNTIPGALLVHGGRYWVTGSTKVGVDTDAFLFRVEQNGSGASFRRFDMRGSQIDRATPVVSGGGDMAVFDEGTPSLVVVGSTTYNSRTFWSAAVFQGFDGDLAAAGYGDVLIPTDEYGALLGVATGKGWLASTGSLLNVNGNFDTSFGTIRLLIDAEKRCDLSVLVPEPLEATLHPGSGTPVTINVTNNGTKACGGQVAVGAPFGLSRGGVFGPLGTGLLGAGAGYQSDGAALTYEGPLQRDAHAVFSVSASGDANADNNHHRLHVLFSYCDASLKLVGSAGIVPTEGSRDYEFDIRNRGTERCRAVRVLAAEGVRRTGSEQLEIASGRSAGQELRARVARSGKPGGKVTLRFRVSADGDANPANDTVAFSGRFVRVGDTTIRRAGRRGLRGSARGGVGPASRRLRRLTRVEVAIRKVGRRCRSLRSVRVRWRAGKGRRCPARVWLRARGRSKWSLSLRRRLPRGTYVRLLARPDRSRLRRGLLQPARPQPRQVPRPLRVEQHERGLSGEDAYFSPIVGTVAPGLLAGVRFTQCAARRRTWSGVRLTWPGSANCSTSARWSR